MRYLSRLDLTAYYHPCVLKASAIEAGALSRYPVLLTDWNASKTDQKPETAQERTRQANSDILSRFD